MTVGELWARAPETHVLIVGVAHDVTVEHDVVVANGRLHLVAQLAEELYLRVVQAFQVAYALRVDERDLDSICSCDLLPGPENSALVLLY